MEYINERLSTPVVDSADVIVAGGGIAGVAAAVAAARQGADVMIVEKTALFGGLATNGLISWYEPLCDGRGTQLMYGLPEELLRLSIRYGPDTLPDIWKDRSVPVDMSLVSSNKQDPAGGRYATYFSPTMFQLALDELLLEEGVRIRLCMNGVRPIMAGKHCRGLITESVSGREAYTARAVIDATGDASILYRAGVPCADGKNFFTFIAQEMSLDDNASILSRRKWHGIGSDLFGNGHPEDQLRLSGTSVREETGYLLKGRALLLDEIRDRDRTSNDITALPSQAQFRTSRRLDGGCTLKEEDDHRHNDRSVALLCDFDRPGAWYELPFECLYHPGYDNLLAAGRMISSDGWAWDATRIIPGCAASGQAAGTAAALAVRRGLPLSRLDITALQGALRDGGVRLHREEA